MHSKHVVISQLKTNKSINKQHPIIQTNTLRSAETSIVKHNISLAVTIDHQLHTYNKNFVNICKKFKFIITVEGKMLSSFASKLNKH